MQGSTRFYRDHSVYFASLHRIVFWLQVSCYRPSVDVARSFMRDKSCSDPSRNPMAINDWAFGRDDSREFDRRMMVDAQRFINDSRKIW